MNNVVSAQKVVEMEMAARGRSRKNATDLDFVVLELAKSVDRYAREIVDMQTRLINDLNNSTARFNALGFMGGGWDVPVASGRVEDIKAAHIKHAAAYQQLVDLFPIAFGEVSLVAAIKAAQKAE